MDASLTVCVLSIEGGYGCFPNCVCALHGGEVMDASLTVCVLSMEGGYGCFPNCVCALHG